MARRRRLNYKRVAIAAIALLVVLILLGLLIHQGIKTVKKIFTKEEETVEVSDPNDMTTLYYYDENRKARYEAYQNAHPTFSMDEVVWRVDADLDKEDYVDIITIQAEQADNEVLLINKHFKLADDYEPKDMVLLDTGLYVTEAAYDAYLEMAKAASKEELDLTAGSTYRSIDYQRELYDSYVSRDGQSEADTYSARPGSSEHHTGRAFDMVGVDGTLDSFIGTKEAAWMKENAYQYGFILRYQEEIKDITGYMDEPWHFTYVGKQASSTMHREHILSLEEYYVKYIMFNRGE